MKNKMMKYAAMLLLAGLLTNCASKNKLVYFNEAAGAVGKEDIENYEPKIEVGDLLSINVSANDAETALPFNLYETPIGTQSYSSARPLHHLVKADGSINFPVIGKFQVAGLTTNELTTKLASVLEAFIKKPVINIQLLNFKVTVLGEVNKPGSYAVANGRITILEAIGLAGDLTIYGKRKTVSLIREKEGKRTFVTIDLTNKALFNSPYYYLAQNDVIYVAPNKAKINGSAVGANSGVIVSSISILISIVAILLK